MSLEKPVSSELLLANWTWAYNKWRRAWRWSRCFLLTFSFLFWHLQLIVRIEWWVAINLFDYLLTDVIKETYFTLSWLLLHALRGSRTINDSTNRKSHFWSALAAWKNCAAKGNIVAEIGSGLWIPIGGVDKADEFSAFDCGDATIIHMLLTWVIKIKVTFPVILNWVLYGQHINILNCCVFIFLVDFRLMKRID